MKAMRRHSLVVILVVVFVSSLAAVAFAADKVLGLYNDWGAQTFDEGGKVGCSIWSQPIRDEGKYKKRGAIYAYVTHRPWDKRVNEVSFAAGYTFKKDSTVRLRIGGQRFTLFTDGTTAWSRSAKDDQEIVGAMKRGASMIVSGVSSRGTRTTDTYSLQGFTKAYQAIGKACKVK